jgi:hypothetical protein
MINMAYFGANKWIFMKKFILLLLVVASAFSGFAQQADVPEIVSRQLSSSFSAASDIEWNTLSHERYQAEFIEKGIVKNALFSKSGNLLQLMFPVDVKDFPKEVNSSLLKKFPDFEILEALRVEISQEVTFKVKIKKGKEVFEVIFDIFGRVRRQVKMEAYSENAICEKGDDAYCERHGKKHKVNHNKKEKNNKNPNRGISSI